MEIFLKISAFLQTKFLFLNVTFGCCQRLLLWGNGPKTTIFRIAYSFYLLLNNAIRRDINIIWDEYQYHLGYQIIWDENLWTHLQVHPSKCRYSPTVECGTKFTRSTYVCWCSPSSMRSKFSYIYCSSMQSNFISANILNQMTWIER